MKFGEFIKDLRSSKGLSQRQLAELAKISNTEVSRIESGERQKPSPNILKALAPHLGITYGELMSKAGYIEEKIDHNTYTESIWRDENGDFADTIRMAKQIQNRDSDLIRIMNRATDTLSDEDIDTIKAILDTFASDNLDDDEKTTLKTIAKSILKNKNK